MAHDQKSRNEDNDEVLYDSSYLTNSAEASTNSNEDSQSTISSFLTPTPSFAETSTRQRVRMAMPVFCKCSRKCFVSQSKDGRAGFLFSCTEASIRTSKRRRRQSLPPPSPQDLPWHSNWFCHEGWSRSIILNKSAGFVVWLRRLVWFWWLLVGHTTSVVEVAAGNGFTSTRTAANARGGRSKEWQEITTEATTTTALTHSASSRQLTTTMIATTPPGYNCESLTPGFQVRWRVVRSRNDAAAEKGGSSVPAIAFELITRGMDHEQVYIGLGVSGRPDEPHMIGGDVVIADYFQGKPRARDFYMNARAPCSSRNREEVVAPGQSALGVCPDTAETFVNDIATDRISGVRLQHGDYHEEEYTDEGNGLLESDDNNDVDDLLTLIRYRHPVTPHDVDVIRNGSHDVDRVMSIQQGVLTTIIWALGPIDQETGQPLFHTYGHSKKLIQWELGRSPPVDNCDPLVLDQAYEDENYHHDPHFEEPVIYPFTRPVLTDTVEFRANLGPSGGERGYPSITGGRTPDRLAWYINDILLPVIEMRRGTKYRFLVNGGSRDSKTIMPEERVNHNDEYHPFYLTSSISGGYALLDPTERIKQRILAGIRLVAEQPEPNSPYVVSFEPTAVGPLCLYTETSKSHDAAAGGYLEYFSSLNTSCAWDPDIVDNAGVLEFTPDSTTPDLIYYQSVTHSNLGWEIHVIDDDAPSIVSVSCEHFWSSPVQLTSELTFHGIVDPLHSTISIELVYRGLAWIAVAFTKDGKPEMVGSEAIIGLPPTTASSSNTPKTPMVKASPLLLPDADLVNVTKFVNKPKSSSRVKKENPAKYFMFSNSVPGVVPMPEEQQTLINATIAQTQTLTILRFTKRLFELGENPIFTDRPNLFLFAHGSNDNLNSYHTSFGAFELLPNQCGLFINGKLQNEHGLYQQHGSEGLEIPEVNRWLWIGHGACAVLAWGILVPIAIGVSIIRNFLVKVLGFHEDSLFCMHRTLNLVAGFLTVVAFGLAVRAINVSTMNGTDPQHFSGGISHRRVGLIVLVLMMIQIGNGLCRPRLYTNAKTTSSLDETGSQNRSRSRSGRPPQPPILPPRVKRCGPVPETADDEAIRRIAECARYLTEENTLTLNTSNEDNVDSSGNPSLQESIDKAREPERAVWEISHRLYGFLLLGLTWWQIHVGIGLFRERFDDEYSLDSVERYFWIMLSCLAGSIGVIAIFSRSWCEKA